MVRLLADVPFAGTGRVGFDMPLQASRGNHMAKHRLGHRRAADVAGADKQDANRFGLGWHSFDLYLQLRCARIIRNWHGTTLSEAQPLPRAAVSFALGSINVI